MTDQQKLCALLEEFGVEYFTDGAFVMLSEGAVRVGGYPGFYTRFDFSADGVFEEVGAYE